MKKDLEWYVRKYVGTIPGVRIDRDENELRASYATWSWSCTALVSDGRNRALRLYYRFIKEANPPGAMIGLLNAIRPDGGRSELIVEDKEVWIRTITADHVARSVRHVGQPFEFFMEVFNVGK